MLNHFDLWRIHIPDHLDAIEREIGLLVEAEQKRSDSYVRQEDRNRYVLGKIYLKKLLSSYLKTDPSELEFKYSDQQKPTLENFPWVHFNVSHSGDYIIIGFANKWSVGVDIEQMTPNVDLYNMIINCMSSTEVSVILNSEMPRQMFYKYWTRKEALLKGLGIGLTDRLKDISCSDGLNLVPIEFSGFASTWKVWSFEMEDSYSVSIAHDAAIRVMRFYEV
ncbi:4'-phosphopantetheinyl transferase superfamily protein [Algoriphagus sp. H41]|uniref:4'-phosphopantetheinyl transferase superfamily protein n=1 Tax=Algoriphagus oliviformis TaxID=2811231 RepID=A0ABS3C2D4_9BACT|nr:4'-phosphopantetheinyl transferase superfamily protein [Algoriphagus oliviformis]MBN7810761.1 4'-phosphopantetheinyl transferase superfamily protein [Algoriphagus oliviformis]